MASDELDLERGDPSRADDTSERRRRRRQRDSGSSGSSGTSTSKTEAREDTEITSRLDRVLDRIAKAREAKGDDELADVIREDGGAMAQGVMSLTTNFKRLRLPLIMFLNLLEPLLAFGRVGRILGRRVMERRLRKQAEREAAYAEEEYANNGGAVEVPVR